MNEHDESIESMRQQAAEAAGLEIATGTTEFFGFPENPTMQQTQCWHNQERVISSFGNRPL